MSSSSWACLFILSESLCKMQENFLPWYWVEPRICTRLVLRNYEKPGIPHKGWLRWEAQHTTLCPIAKPDLGAHTKVALLVVHKIHIFNYFPVKEMEFRRLATLSPLTLLWLRAPKTLHRCLVRLMGSEKVPPSILAFEERNPHKAPACRPPCAPLPWGLFNAPALEICQVPLCVIHCSPRPYSSKPSALKVFPASLCLGRIQNTISTMKIS